MANLSYPMNHIVECVPNFSEGRDRSIIRRITDQIETVRGVELLDVDPGQSTNRTVVTFVGPPEAVAEAAFRAVRQAAELIDMTRHTGEHPRMGATDVLPFVPVAGATMDDCVRLARKVGRRIGQELGIPVYLYERAATRPERANLANVRTGEYEGLPKKLADPRWAPDFGPAAFNARSGATAVGAREFLIAYNVNLNTMDRRLAEDIAYDLRERGRWLRRGDTEPYYYRGEVVCFEAGRFPCGACEHVAESVEALSIHYRKAHGGDLAARYRELGMDPQRLVGEPVYKDGMFAALKAVGWVVEDFRRAQISMNLTDFHMTPPHLVLEAARELARRRGIVVTGSEVVGLIPADALLEAGRYYLKKQGKSIGVPNADLVEIAILSMGLNDVAPFDPAKKLIGMPRRSGPLVQRSVADFADEVSRDTPAPGGGSIAALAGALGAALAAMVGNLSAGKPKLAQHRDEAEAIAQAAQQVKDALLIAVDEDTLAFNAVLDAMRLPKDTAEQRDDRARAMREGYKAATRVPLHTAELALQAMRLCRRATQLGNVSAMSDAAVGALTAYAGLQGAAFNVRINLPHTGEAAFSEETLGRVAQMLEEAGEIRQAVETALSGAL